MTLVERLRESARAGRAIDRAELLNEAASAIEVLEAMRQRSSEAFNTTLSEMSRYAFKSGWLEGALTYISWGHSDDPVKAAKDALRKFKEPKR